MILLVFVLSIIALYYSTKHSVDHQEQLILGGSVGLLTPANIPVPVLGEQRNIRAMPLVISTPIDKSCNIKIQTDRSNDPLYAMTTIVFPKKKAFYHLRALAPSFLAEVLESNFQMVMFWNVLNAQNKPVKEDLQNKARITEYSTTAITSGSGASIGTFTNTPECNSYFHTDGTQEFKVQLLCGVTNILPMPQGPKLLTAVYTDKDFPGLFTLTEIV
jgi:hypothetical protein